MKNVVILTCLLFSLNSFSQKIDSINVINQSTPPEIHVYGKLYHTGYSITDVGYVVSDSIFLTLFFKKCNGYQVLVPFDTVLTITESWPMVPNEINIISILDTNTTDLNCIIVTQYDTLEINTFSNSILGVDNLFQSENIKIYPNPLNDILHIDVSDDLEIEGIDIYNSNGKRVKSFSKTDKILRVSELVQGIYFLKISTKKGEVTKKIFIE
jgi:hypothetical protein